VLGIFVAWEHQRRNGSPLIELGLFRSRGFTWGTLLTTLISFAMFGMFFAVPQYFQEVLGTNALGSGLRLLPMIGGMVVGMIGGTRLASARKAPDGSPARAPLAGAKLLMTVGFVIMAAGLGIGALTKFSSGTGYAAIWIAMSGLGMGLAMPQGMNVALGALSAERSGSGSALISALRQVGATIGVAVLGTVLSSGYHDRLNLTGLPTAATGAVRSSVAGGVEVAHKLNSLALLDNVRHAFIHGMDIMLWACGGIALVSAVLALIFLPRQNTASSEPAGAGETSAERAGLGV
jgi:DHA2 family multidrug resistance protein-like MFS transporter